MYVDTYIAIHIHHHAQTTVCFYRLKTWVNKVIVTDEYLLVILLMRSPTPTKEVWINTRTHTCVRGKWVLRMQVAYRKSSESRWFSLCWQLSLRYTPCSPSPGGSAFGSPLCEPHSSLFIPIVSVRFNCVYLEVRDGLGRNNYCQKFGTIDRHTITVFTVIHWDQIFTPTRNFNGVLQHSLSTTI